MHAKAKAATAATAAAAGSGVGTTAARAVLPAASVLQVYRALSWVADRVAPVVAARYAATRTERRGAIARWRARAAAGASGAVWVHAASVGEALTAVPIVRRLRAARPHIPIVLTHTSPTPARWPGGWEVDHSDYLPLDTPRAMDAMVEALAPALLVLTRADVWPELLSATLRRGIPVALTAATVTGRSHRLRWPVRAALQPLYAALAYVGAVTEDDGERLRRLGVREAALEVTGDPRHDQVLERIPDLGPLRPLARWTAAGEVLVAGSTDGSDAAVLLDALAAVRRSRPAARLLLCPHEPGPRETERLLALARRNGIPAAAWTGGPPAETAACLVSQQLGALADLYAVGRLAYVGGGFGGRGVHAVIEPAAYAVPTIVGPRGLSGDAHTLLAGGGAVALPVHGAARRLGEAWHSWLAHEDARVRAGLAARTALSAGAAQRTVDGLLGLFA